eukprot:2976606-Amphidinium_carterae.2
MKFLARKFGNQQFDVVAIQETRIPSSGLSKAGDYQVVGLSSRAGNGGLHLWLHKRLHSQVLWHKGFGTPSAHEAFLGHLTQAITSAKKPTHRLILLGDLNLRVKGMDARVCGPYSMSEPVAGSWERTEKLALESGPQPLHVETCERTTGTARLYCSGAEGFQVVHYVRSHILCSFCNGSPLGPLPSGAQTQGLC